MTGTRRERRTGLTRQGIGSNPGGRRLVSGVAGRLSGRHLVQRDADSPDIGVGPKLTAQGLLGRHVARRANAASSRSRTDAPRSDRALWPCRGWR